MNDAAYAPTVHHSTREGGTPSCGTHGMTMVDTRWPVVTCKKCYKTDQWYAHHAAEQERLAAEQALTDAAVKRAVNEVFAKAREIADRAGYCSTYQEIESEIIADLPYEIEASKREYEVEVEVETTIRWYETVTVEAASEDEACRMVEDDPDAHLDGSIHDWSPSGGYTESGDTTVISTSASEA